MRIAKDTNDVVSGMRDAVAYMQNIGGAYCFCQKELSFVFDCSVLL